MIRKTDSSKTNPRSLLVRHHRMRAATLAPTQPPSVSKGQPAKLSQMPNMQCKWNHSHK